MDAVDNRYREYRVTLPLSIAAEIRRRALEQKRTELDVIRQLIAKGLVIHGVQRGHDNDYQTLPE